MKKNSKVKLFNIKNREAIGQRIDNFLFLFLKGIPHSKIYHIIRNGEIRINSARIKPYYKIQYGDLIRIPPLFYEKKKKSYSGNLKFISFLNNCIIYEDKFLLVLNKPSGIATHGGSKINFGVIEAFRVLRPREKFLNLVHRLDRDTSGILLIAKKKFVLLGLHDQFYLRKVEKRYIALVKGRWDFNVEVIETGLTKTILPNGERVIKIVSNGKKSITKFKIVEFFYNSTLIEINPITGRTHQIRVHTQYAQHPIAYDKRYGDKVFNNDLNSIGLNQLFLHASSLTIFHPSTKEQMTFRAPLGQDLLFILEKLRKNPI